MVSCNISGAEVALLGRAGNFVALSSWPAAQEPLADPLERLEPENFRESAVRRGRRAAQIGEIRAGSGSSRGTAVVPTSGPHPALGKMLTVVLVLLVVLAATAPVGATAAAAAW